MRDVMKIHNNILKTGWENYQRNLIPPPRCKGCEEECIILYDNHHDEYFSYNCGKVVLEMGQYIMPYSDLGFDYEYDTEDES